VDSEFGNKLWWLKTQQLKFGTGTAIWWVTEPHFMKKSSSRKLQKKKKQYATK
jgi:hypothetical protein